MNTKESSKEQLILQAAEQEFLEKGFNMAKTTQIAKRAGVTHAMLHYYFRTKENLFDMIFQQKAEVIANTLFMEFNQDLPFLEKLQKAIESHFDILCQNPQLPRFIINEIVHVPERRKRFVEIVKPKVINLALRIENEMREEMAKGNIREIDPIDLIYTTVSLNIMIFLVAPGLREVQNLGEDDFNAFLQLRKKQNVETILKRVTL